MKKHNRDVGGLIKFAKEKNEKTLLCVEQTLQKMIDDQQTITFSSVAKQAQVSRSWLYKNAEIKNKIELMRQQQSDKKPRNTTSPSAHKHEKVIENLKSRVKKLQRENTKLLGQLEAVYGKMVE